MEDFERFYNKALRFLSYRPRSEKEMRDRLKIKYQKSNIKDLTLVIDKVTQKLKEQKFINDEEFAKWWIEQRTTFNPKSRQFIKNELRQKGVSQDLIDKIFNSQFSILNEKEIIKKLIDKKLKRLRGLSRNEAYQKLGQFLSSKGFDWDVIKQSIDEVLSKGV